jgi:hypothetical protein
MNGKSVANWMIERDLDHHRTWIPITFMFYVHSQNPTGAGNIEALLCQYMDDKRADMLGNMLGSIDIVRR